MYNVKIILLSTVTELKVNAKRLLITVKGTGLLPCHIHDVCAILELSMPQHTTGMSVAVQVLRTLFLDHAHLLQGFLNASHRIIVPALSAFSMTWPISLRGT